MNFGEALKALRKKSNITQAELAKKCSVSQGTIANWEAGKRTPDARTVVRVAEILGVTADSLLRPDFAAPEGGGVRRTEGVQPPMQGEMSEGQRGSGGIPNAERLPSEMIRMVPVFESVSAGFGVGAENRVVEFIPLFIESDYEYQRTICVRVCGDSMYPQIQDGDLVQVLKQEQAESGEIVVILDGDNAYVKRFIHGKNGVTLESFNPQFAPMRFSREESNALRIVGVVKRIIREI